MTAVSHTFRISLLLLGVCALVGISHADDASTSRAQQLKGAYVYALARPSSTDDESTQRGNQLKAAYLFNFVKFVEWPQQSSGDAIEICFVGAAGVQESLQASVAARSVGARPVVLRTLHRDDSPGRCGVIYFESSAAGINEIQLQSARTTALTVSDAQNFTHNGGVIQLFITDNRLRFVVNIENAKRAGLRISSNLLNLAWDVEQ